MMPTYQEIFDAVLELLQPYKVDAYLKGLTANAVNAMLQEKVKDTKYREMLEKADSYQKCIEFINHELYINSSYFSWLTGCVTVDTLMPSERDRQLLHKLLHMWRVKFLSGETK